MSGRKLIKQACDGCKIRKIKCSGVSPCEGCQATGIACTFVKQQAARGPRSLRKNTLREIAQTQHQWEQMTVDHSAQSGGPRAQEDGSAAEFAPGKIAALVLQLCVYRLRTYPIWPIIKMERLVASLQKPDPDIEVLALAYAVAAATIARIAPQASAQPGGVSAAVMAESCLRTRSRRNRTQAPDLTTVRIPLFLHFFYESIEPGGLESITSLREAIAVAHMIGLHRESYYENVPPEEQEIRRRSLWLLFVTERCLVAYYLLHTLSLIAVSRGISISYKLPVIIKTKLELPSLNDSDEPEVLLAYQKLVTMFWHFDQVGLFDLLDSQDFDIANLRFDGTEHGEAFALVRKHLDDSSTQSPATTEVQSLENLVTRQWMKIIIWRLTESYGLFTNGLQNDSSQLNEPVQIARELLGTVSQADKAAIEAHGNTLDIKIFQVASTVADVISLSPATMQTSDNADQLRLARETLFEMYTLLSKNQTLTSMLFEKMTRLQSSAHLELGPDFAPHGRVESTIAWDIDNQLRQDGFHFTDTFTAGYSPEDFTTSPELQELLEGNGIPPSSTPQHSDTLFWNVMPEHTTG